MECRRQQTAHPKCGGLNPKFRITEIPLKRWLNQDCLDNLFGCIRNIGGNNDAKGFVTAVKKVTPNHLKSLEMENVMMMDTNTKLHKPL